MNLNEIFYRTLSDRGISDEIARLSELGLIWHGKVVGYFTDMIPDKFFDKIGLIFPIKNLYNITMSYYLKLPKGSYQKYDSLPFEKNLLFGLNYAYPYIIETNSVILVEGPFDAFSLWSAGFRNTVASLGTSLNFFQICLLRRFATVCYVVFDGDTVGKDASNKIIQKLSDVGIMCKDIILPNSLDPDEFIKTYGGQSFKELLYAK